MSATATIDPAAPSVPEGWRVTPEGTVPVSDVARTTGDYPAVNYTVRRCGVTIASSGGHCRTRYIPVSEALLLVAAAALALAAGVALAQMYRAIKASGATVGPNALTIPLNLGK
ncbi:hypothetical protein [Streptomyces sp. ISL-100]|uniref:hypothetical protein n=1 Tax=Streptomyces sp. ISL-100 TaxID=2819173 RepID=UPI001BEA2EB9|nr:hypothetical protein [Streptomyces sp. ISL-100]MBT2395940.1 hypothetical protein [Streptomyces sp. ISL-100]